MRKIIIMYKSVRGNRKTRSKNKQFSLFVFKTQPTLDKVHMQGQPSAALVQHCVNGKTEEAAMLYGHSYIQCTRRVAAASQHSWQVFPCLYNKASIRWGEGRGSSKNREMHSLKTLTMRPEKCATLVLLHWQLLTQWQVRVPHYTTASPS